jgi:hypothetical protein
MRILFGSFTDARDSKSYGAGDGEIQAPRRSIPAEAMVSLVSAGEKCTDSAFNNRERQKTQRPAREDSSGPRELWRFVGDD